MRDISEFGLHELDDYNEMIRCLSAFKEDFIQCNHDIRRLAKTAYNVFPENSTLGKAFKCCGIWMVRDCWYKKAEESCPKNQLHLIHKMPHKLLPSLHEWCDDYRDDSMG
ncbi:unnamed protein product [Medioppia subpectinata]|uniref:Uncharacterized protein n=1 Tax=Medioppia subpectinata TaxID=1979941 RepID=A0A7R9KJ86_9ACAR|nr:unnamed protein product [Medioppia subpectinata]CAG2103184.1 unnamed protein product [Medioppia subpectinata]